MSLTQTVLGGHGLSNMRAGLQTVLDLQKACRHMRSFMGKSSQERHVALESQFLALQKLKEKAQRVGRE